MAACQLAMLIVSTIQIFLSFSLQTTDMFILTVFIYAADEAVSTDERGSITFGVLACYINCLNKYLAKKNINVEQDPFLFAGILFVLSALTQYFCLLLWKKYKMLSMTYLRVSFQTEGTLVFLTEKQCNLRIK